MFALAVGQREVLHLRETVQRQIERRAPETVRPARRRRCSTELHPARAMQLTEKRHQSPTLAFQRRRVGEPADGAQSGVGDPEWGRWQCTSVPLLLPPCQIELVEVCRGLRARTRTAGLGVLLRLVDQQAKIGRRVG